MWRKLLKVAAFVIFPTSKMVLLETNQRFNPLVPGGNKKVTYA